MLQYHGDTEKIDRQFRLGTTSFIFPDHIIPNVEQLGPYFDEIELLIFESQPKDVLPSEDRVKELFELSQTLDLAYNIHLPIDISITCDRLDERKKAVDTLSEVIQLFSPLKPSTYTLHLDMPENVKKDSDSFHKWSDNTHQGLGALLNHVSNPGLISIETLDYPFSIIEPMIEEFNLSVCMDIGHLVKYGYNLLETYGTNQNRTAVIHLHGVDFKTNKIKDHTSLDKLPEETFKEIVTILRRFEGVVSLEVFNLKNLNDSLKSLSQLFKHIIPCVKNE